MRAVAGSEAVISILGPAKGAPPDLLRRAGANIAAAMRQEGVRRVLALTGAGIGAPGDPTSLGRSVMTSLLRLLARLLAWLPGLLAWPALLGSLIGLVGLICAVAGG
jgi:hypothetical protein